MLQNVTFARIATKIGFIVLGTSAMATSLSVSPTKIEVPQGSAQATMTIKSAGRGPSVVQLRIFSWKEGQDPARLKQTSDVVVSPPMAKLGARQELTVRLVRTSKRRVKRRECYRILVDRLPSQRADHGEISIRLRHSVPVCFNG